MALLRRESADLAAIVEAWPVLPDMLRDAEAWHANGRPPAPPANRRDRAAMRQRFDRLAPTIIDANTRANAVLGQGRLQSIIERLAAWGLWKEPDTLPPDIATSLARFERVFPQ